MTTAPKPKDTLVLAAARLSRAAPNMWLEFMSAFEAYARDRESACVLAPADRVLLAQGGARQTNELADLFKDAAKPK